MDRVLHAAPDEATADQPPASQVAPCPTIARCQPNRPPPAVPRSFRQGGPPDRSSDARYRLEGSPTGTDRLFDFYESGALDAAFVAGGEVNAKGDWNTSYLGGSLFGAGGLTSIVHSTKRIFVFCKFTRGGLKTKSGDGKLHIIQEGKVAKWIRNISDVTASGEYRLKHGQQVKYITERGVFRLEPRGIVLEEIAPGVDLRHDILERAEFEIFVDDNLKEMDRRIFLDQPMGMRDILLSQ